MHSLLPGQVRIGEARAMEIRSEGKYLSIAHKNVLCGIDEGLLCCHDLVALLLEG